MRYITFFILTCFPWQVFSSINSNDSIYQKTKILTGTYSSNSCIGNYNGELNTEFRWSQCKTIYRQFLDLVDSVSGTDEFPDYIKFLWKSDDVVLSRELIFKTAIAANGASLPPALRPYLTNLELESLAYHIVRDSASTEEVLRNGLFIFGNLGSEKYIDDLKAVAIDSVQPVAVIAVFNLEKIIKKRELLKPQLRDIYDQTDSDRFRSWLDKFVDKRGGW